MESWACHACSAIGPGGYEGLLAHAETVGHRAAVVRSWRAEVAERVHALALAEAGLRQAIDALPTDHEEAHP